MNKIESQLPAFLVLVLLCLSTSSGLEKMAVIYSAESIEEKAQFKDFRNLIFQSTNQYVFMEPAQVIDLLLQDHLTELKTNELFLVCRILNVSQLVYFTVEKKEATKQMRFSHVKAQLGVQESVLLDWASPPEWLSQSLSLLGPVEEKTQPVQELLKIEKAGGSVAAYQLLKPYQISIEKYIQFCLMGGLAFELAPWLASGGSYSEYLSQLTRNLSLYLN